MLIADINFNGLKEEEAALRVRPSGPAKNDRDEWLFMAVVERRYIGPVVKLMEVPGRTEGSTVMREVTVPGEKWEQFGPQLGPLPFDPAKTLHEQAYAALKAQSYIVKLHADSDE